MFPSQTLIVGQILGAFGIKGWLKIHSFTEPRENILKYSPWLLSKGDEHRQLAVLDGHLQGKGVVVQLADIDERDLAASFSGYTIAVDVALLPKPQANEYYWHDLIGLNVINEQGINLGVVDHLLETGANDVLVLKGDKERLIPFLQGQFVKHIDLATGKMLVDWDSDF